MFIKAHLFICMATKVKSIPPRNTPKATPTATMNKMPEITHGKLNINKFNISITGVGQCPSGHYRLAQTSPGYIDQQRFRAGFKLFRLHFRFIKSGLFLTTVWVYRSQ